MYKKITEEEPPVGVEVWTWNGEFEIKNIHNGKCWEYEMRYPTTHWMCKPKKPPMEEVIEVRDELSR